ncbi:hypothetical protein B0H13DRAFT_2362832 [Mycena leptocephala]|nr:hypothetical protein B0H13DRAFT_2362832 [Mycena leptocephala]
MHAKKHTEDNSESVIHELERIRKYCTVVRVLAHTQIHKTGLFQTHCGLAKPCIQVHEDQCHPQIHYRDELEGTPKSARVLQRQEPELFRGYNPKKKAFNQEIELIHDLEPIEVAESEAHKFKLQHGNKCDIWAGEGGQWFFKLKKGALVFSLDKSLPDGMLADIKTGSYMYKAKLASEIPMDTANVATISDSLTVPSGASGVIGVGVNQELISAVPSSNPTFVSRNFTPLEIAERGGLQLLSVKSKGAAAAMLDIEILNDNVTGALAVRLHGDVKTVADDKVFLKP